MSRIDLTLLPPEFRPLAKLTLQLLACVGDAVPWLLVMSVPFWIGFYVNAEDRGHAAFFGSAAFIYFGLGALGLWRSR